MTPSCTTSPTPAMRPNPAAVRARVRDFIAETFLLAEAGHALDDSASLVADEIIDSTGFLELIGFVESAFDVTVDEADMVEENFESVAAITAFIGRKRRLPA